MLVNQKKVIRVGFEDRWFWNKIRFENTPVFDTKPLEFMGFSHPKKETEELKLLN